MRKIFGSELLFLLSFLVRVFLIGICLWFSRIFSQFRPERVLKKFSSCQVLLFCLVLSVLGFGLTTSCVLFLFLLFFVQETELRSNRTPHPPPALAVVFFVFPRRFVLFRLFWPCVLFVLVFLRVPFWAPCGFRILSGLL